MMSESLEAKLAARLQKTQNKNSSAPQQKLLEKALEGPPIGVVGPLAVMGPPEEEGIPPLQDRLTDKERATLREVMVKIQRGKSIFKQAEEKLEAVLASACAGSQLSRRPTKNFSNASNGSDKEDSLGISPRRPGATRSPGARRNSIRKVMGSQASMSSADSNQAFLEADKDGSRSPKDGSGSPVGVGGNDDKEDDEEMAGLDSIDPGDIARRGGFGKRIQRSSSASFNKDCTLQAVAKRILDHAVFQTISVSLILLTIVLICVDTNARAEGVEAEPWVDVLMLVCFIAYLMEFLATLYVQRMEAFHCHWNYLDGFVISTSLADYSIELAGGLDGFSLLRLLRICRLLRLGRVIRALRRLQAIKALKEQYLLMMMMASCVRTVCWAFLFCMFVMTIWSILAVELLNDIAVRIDENMDIWDDCYRCKRSFHSIWDSNLTFMQTIVAGDSWGLVALPVIEDSWWSLFIFLGALSTVIFGVLNMISVVVIDTFAERRSKDLTHVATELEYEEIQERKQLGKIFQKIDEDQSGELSLEELREGAAKVKEFQQYLRVLDIDEHDLTELFVMIDGDGSGEVDPDEFIDALYRMKTTESKTATRFVKHMVSNLFDKTKLLDERLEMISSNVSSKIDSVETKIRNDILDRGASDERLEYILEDYADEINTTVKEAIDKSVAATFESMVGSAAKKASQAIQGVVMSSSNQVAKMNDRLGINASSPSRQISSASFQSAVNGKRANSKEVGKSDSLVALGETKEPPKRECSNRSKDSLVALGEPMP